MRSFLLVCLLVLFSQSGWAAGYLTPYGAGVEITKVFVHNEGGVTFIVGGLENPDGCSDISKVHLPADVPGFDAMLSVALTAYASNKSVGFWSGVGCSVLPFWGGSATSPIIHTLWVTD